mmetsp:Transcript_14549/g.34563  ORF Transcript_14549/g.34563 Transcript_14549/m.34563 type:complete len:288 (+) Transcript_14549:653-1516(+)
MWREGQSKALGLGITHSAAVNIYVVASEQEALPFDLRHLKVVYRPFELTSFALSLLLVFRTEASYARWEAARSNWMTVITACRNLSGLGRGYSGARGAGRVAAVCRWTAAYAWCLKDHLQPTNDLRARLQPLLSDGEAAFLLVGGRPAPQLLPPFTPSLFSSPILLLFAPPPPRRVASGLSSRGGFSPPLLPLLSRLQLAEPRPSPSPHSLTPNPPPPPHWARQFRLDPAPGLGEAMGEGPPSLTWSMHPRIQPTVPSPPTTSTLRLLRSEKSRRACMGSSRGSSTT